MKKYTNEDIEQMLMLTEKTEKKDVPEVVFREPERKAIPVRKFFPRVIAAACVLALAVAAFSVVLIADRSGQSEMSGQDDMTQGSNDFSAGSGFSGDGSSIAVSEGGDTTFTDPSEDERSTAAAESSEDSIYIGALPPLLDETGEGMFDGKGISDKSMLGDFFVENGLTDGKYKTVFPVYRRDTLEDTERMEILEKLSDYFALSLSYDSEIFAQDGVLAAISDTGRGSISINAYGDYSLAFADGVLVSNCDAMPGDPESFVEAAYSLIEGNREIFGNGEFVCSAEYAGGGYIVSVRLDDPRELKNTLFPVFTIKLLIKTLDGKQVCFVRYIRREMSGYYFIGNYESARYWLAETAISSGRCYGEKGYVLPADSRFSVLGYDIRYIADGNGSELIPYYAIVISVDTGGEKEEVHTLFTRALKDSYFLSEGDYSEYYGAEGSAGSSAQ